MQLVNLFNFDRTISTNEVLPFNMTFTNIPSQSGNTVTLARRIDYSLYADYQAGITTTYENISTNTVVALNVVTVTDIWDVDTPAAGNYVIKVVLKDNTGTVSDEEMNIFIRVVKG